MHKPVRKAVFPVAGLGTRILPATKAMAKEMLTVVDKPLIHYAVEEAKAAGIEQFYFVTGRGKGAIEDHFDVAYEMEATLKERGKDAQLQRCRRGCRPPARSPIPGSSGRWGSAMRCGAPGIWSATSRSPCCWSTI